MNQILHLREVTLEPNLAYKLTPFINAHKPHTSIPTKDELGEPINVKEETTMQEIQRLRRNQSYHKQEYIKRQNKEAYRILSEQYYEIG